MKRILIYAIVLAALSSCITLDSPHPRRFERSVLIYIAGDNNGLESYAETNLSYLVAGYLPFRTDSDEVLLVFVDDGGGQTALYRYYYGEDRNVYRELARRYEEPFCSAKASSLSLVLDDAERLYPSRHRGLVLWSHGTGWLPVGYYSNPSASKSFAQEGECEMDVRDLAGAVCRHYDFILFDCCLMSAVEVAYQLRDKADYIIASCAEILAEGFPYGEIVGDMFCRSGVAPAFYVNICEKYFSHYDACIGAGRSATVSLIDCGALEELAAVCKDIYASNREARAGVDPATVQHYFRGNKRWFYDLDDYVSKFASETQYERFKLILDRCVPYRQATDMILGQIEVRTHCGLSTYIPDDKWEYLNQYYSSLDWAVDVGVVY